MDINRAKAIISTLAEGVDPTTGEVLPDNSVCNKGEIVRALYTVLNCLDEKKSKKNLPANAGKPWSAEEDERLLTAYRKGNSRSEISRAHQRTKGSIVARLAKLGEIIERSDIE